MFTRFLAELRRRRVLNVAGVYVVLAWLIIQVVTAVFPPLHIPEWGQTFVIVLLIIGFPVAVILAWAFEFTAQGVVREDAATYQVTRDAGPYLVVTVLIITVAAGLWLLLPDRGPSASRQQDVTGSSIAVLPFEDLSEAEDNEFFTDGLTEALLHTLAGIPGLSVAARTSSFAYKGAQRDVREIGRELGVATVLEGSVRKSADNLKITAQLIEVENGYHLWSNTYDARMGDIFRIQEQISRAIAEALKVTLLPDSRDLVQPGTRDASAYDLYLQARGVLRGAEVTEDYETAIDLFDHALRKDPVFAAAEAGLCAAYWGQYETTRDPTLVDAALDTCDRASVLDPNAADVQLALGGLYTGTGRSEFAIEALTEAIGLEPRNDEAHRGLGIALEQAKRTEAAEQSFREAVRLNPDYWRNYSALAVFLARQGRFQEAVDAYQTSLDLNPDNPKAWASLGGIHFMMGDFEKAGDAFSYSIAYSPTANGYSNAGTNYYYAGNYEKAHEMFRKAVDLKPNDYRLVGNLADACRVLDGACRADVYYRQALELADQQLQVDPDDGLLFALRALYQANLGDPVGAEQSIRRARQRDPDSFDVQWTIGLARHIMGDRDAALKSIRRALAGGYPFALVEADPDLSALAPDLSSDQ